MVRAAVSSDNGEDHDAARSMHSSTQRARRATYRTSESSRRTALARSNIKGLQTLPNAENTCV